MSRYICTCTHVRVCHASRMSISNALGMSRRTQKHLAHTLFIRYTRAKSKQQRAQGYGRAEVLGLQPQSCRRSRRTAKKAYLMTSHTQSVRMLIY